MQKNSTLLIPGLGDDESLDSIKKYWKLRNRHVDTFDTRWATDESATDKFKRLCEFYESLEKKDVVLISVSAGGALATQLLAKYPEIAKALFISTKVKGSDTIGLPFQRRAPAILASVKASEEALKSVEKFENKSTVYRPIIDEVVPLKDMLVGNASRKRVLAIGHPIGIGAALIFYIP